MADGIDGQAAEFLSGVAQSDALDGRLGVNDAKWKETDQNYLSIIQSTTQEASDRHYFGKQQTEGLTPGSEAPDSSKAVAPTIDLHQLRQLRRIFEDADTDGSGNLDEAEFVRGFTPVLGDTMTAEDLRQLFLRIDANANGVVDWDEFSAYILLSGEHMLREDTANQTYVRRTEGCGGGNEDARSPRSHKAQGEHSTLASRLLVTARSGRYYTCGRDGTVRVWGAQSLAYERTIYRGRSWITDGMITRNGSRLTVCAMDKSVSIFEISTTGSGELWKVLRGVADSKRRVPQQEAAKRQLVDADEIPGVCNGEAPGGVPRLRSGRREIMQRMQEGGGERGKALVELQTLSGLRECPMSIAEWENYMCLGLRNGSVQLYDPMSTAEDNPRLVPCAATYPLHRAPVARICTAKFVDGVITAGWDHHIKIVSLERGKITRTLGAVGGHQKSIFALEWSEPHRLLASAGTERHVFIWNPYIAKPMHRLDGHHQPLVSICFNDAQHQLISLSVDKILKVWDLRTLKCLQTICEDATHTPEDTLSCLTFDARRGAIACASSRPTIFPVRSTLSSFPAEPLYRGHHHPVATAIYNPKFQQIISADNSRIILWDATQGERLSHFDCSLAGGPMDMGASEDASAACVTALDLDQNGRRLLVTAHSCINCFNFASGQLLREYALRTKDGAPLPGSRGREAVGAVFVTDSERNTKLVVAAIGSTVAVWEDPLTQTSGFMRQRATRWRILRLPDTLRAELPDPQGDGDPDTARLSITCVCLAQPRTLALGTDAGLVTLYCPASNDLESWLGRLRPGVPVETVVPHAVLEALLVATDCELTAFSLRHKSLLFVVPHIGAAGPRSVAAVAVSRDGLIATGDDVGQVYVWAPNDKRRQPFTSPTNQRGTGQHQPGTPHSPLRRMDTSAKAGGNLGSPGSPRSPAPLSVTCELVRIFPAHALPIVAIQVLQFGPNVFLLTCSADSQLRMFSLSGHYVGYFGQPATWAPTDSQTWAERWLDRGKGVPSDVPEHFIPGWTRPPVGLVTSQSATQRRQADTPPDQRGTALGWFDDHGRGSPGQLSNQSALLECTSPVAAMLRSPHRAPRPPAPPRSGGLVTPSPAPATVLTAGMASLRPVAEPMQTSRASSPLQPQLPLAPRSKLHPRRLTHNRILSARVRRPRRGPGEESCPSHDQYHDGDSATLAASWVPPSVTLPQDCLTIQNTWDPYRSGYTTAAPVSPLRPVPIAGRRSMASTVAVDIGLSPAIGSAHTQHPEGAHEPAPAPQLTTGTELGASVFFPGFTPPPAAEFRPARRQPTAPQRQPTTESVGITDGESRGGSVVGPPPAAPPRDPSVNERVVRRREEQLRRCKGETAPPPDQPKQAEDPALTATSERSQEVHRRVEQLGRHKASGTVQWTARPTLRLHCREPVPVQPIKFKIPQQPEGQATQHLRALGRVAMAASLVKDVTASGTEGGAQAGAPGKAF
eukprot:TRINITY_DN7625_c0_g1_i1.p1 TRINITY_DN7625_c0_g1~~TRINITY_DN7625_c0_g1_i1.p1  ORF type:complete len:1468 (+),score=290.56 TRINITY_DN7625_c0_g1_i1:143-4546(+)